ncbi:MAG: DUF2199 domain-containing protein [Gammaproteobacteria bacterium]
MAGIFSFKCACCGRIHEGSPSFGFAAPDPYLEQPQKTQREGHLGTDLCHYDDADGRHYFIRAVLEVPIHGVAEPFLWGVWVSLSEASYRRYVETYDDPDPGDRFFGWLCNYLPYYPNTYALKTQVRPGAKGERPNLELQDNGHPLETDFVNGISADKAREIAVRCLHPGHSGPAVH